MMEQDRLLKTAFLAGAITDAAHLLPMLVPELAPCKCQAAHKVKGPLSGTF